MGEFCERVINAISYADNFVPKSIHIKKIKKLTDVPNSDKLASELEAIVLNKKTTPVKNLMQKPLRI